MFPLHESTQRSVCRTLFLAFCLVPTTSLLVYALWLKTPLHRSALASGISDQTGVLVSLSDLCYPRPGVTRLKNVELTHSQTQQPLGQVQELEIQHTADGVQILAAQPQIKAEHFDELLRQIQQHLLEASFPPDEDIHVIAHDATLITPDGEAQTFAVLEGEFQQRADGRTLALKYQAAQAPAKTSPAVLRLVRRIDEHGQENTKFFWDTGEAELPLAPWTSQLPWLDAFGDNCKFRGVVATEQGRGGTRGKVTGTLSQIDLNRLVSDSFPHKLSGEAHVEIHNITFDAGCLNELHLGIEAGPGVIGRLLLQRATEEWRLKSDKDVSALKKLTPYQRINCDVQLVQGRLHIDGTCPGSDSGTMLTRNDGAFTMPDGAEYDPASLIRILSSSDTANIPATESSRQLLRWLPLADERASEDITQPSAHLGGATLPES